MCGICGELRIDGSAPNLDAITRMNRALERRGPDHGGSYSDGPLAFGHRRLAIIDLSERANQPLIDNELGLALVFNGTIYNYRELRADLQAMGYHFFSDGDSEVIIKAYAAWGERCVERFAGMFAFAIWEMRAKRLFLARDRLGIKPLYYSEQQGCLRFASNTQALLASGGIDKSIDPVALHHQFTLHAVIPAPRTILNGIRKLSPATTLTIESNGRQQERTYWHLAAQRPEQEMSEDEWVEAVHDSLRQSVERRRLAADVPVGVLLSGGLDSSLLVGLMAESGVENLLTFSVGFEDQPEEKGSEFEYSDLVVERFNTHHHKYEIPNGEVLKRLPEAVSCMAEPMVGQDAVAFYLLSEKVSQEVKVVQSGQGADEVFGGYFWYPRMRDEIVGEPVDRFRRHYFDRDHDEFLESVTAAYRGEDYTAERVAGLLSRPMADSFIDQVLRMDVTTLIVDDPVKRVDNMTMAWGLEARVPFLDHDLVELAMAMPPEMRLKEGGKYPLKRIARGLIPDAVIDRPKGYFPVPALKFVRGEFLDFMRDILDSQACRERELFNRSYVERLLAEPETHHTRILGSKLWHMALLEFWLQTNVD
ncbi:asparagine synthase (glutamine-hydrolyzing) [Solemya pervernicosa gill symbiont]|uniref:asparagine synthase (glutamine-hydrolyzing) n=2 Tax=Gammaproteobacteria incertae sedis TaxID=118884 RepID=A0A1T2L4Q9_9GAMM|nr:N-acetylglutaminylglutamine amidotransferase [Solemya pervernicosa gill symbiont]OOZ40054.1 asparagine synthase (glutamine-hydrolyzing) [Solemya pervernicosa gill symbiont]